MTNLSENKNYYIQIADWMLEYKLPVNELLTYAIVYGYCQSNSQDTYTKNSYFGSTKTMADLLGIGEDAKGHASTYLNNLKQKGLLYKEEVKKSGQQKMCRYYAISNWTGRVEDQAVGYLNIQPWMFKTLGLRNNLLIIYARIYNLSVNRNIYYFDSDDLAFWTNSEPRKMRGYINKLLEANLIEKKLVNGDEGYIAKIPKNVKQSSKCNTTPQNVTPYNSDDKNTPENVTPSPNSVTPSPQNVTNNNLYNNLYNLKDIIISNTESVKYFDIQKMLDSESVQMELLRIIEAYRMSEESIDNIVRCFEFISKTIDNWGIENIEKINKLKSSDYLKLFIAAQKLMDENPCTPEKLLSIKIRKLIND